MRNPEPPDLSQILRHIQAGSPAIFPLGDGITLDIEPTGPSIGIRTAGGHGPLPDISGYHHLSTALVYADGVAQELRVTGPTVLADGHRLLSDIARQCRRGSSLAESTAESLRRLHELLARQHGIGRGDEIGLWGELHLLQYLIDSIGAADAVASWQGPRGGEHDFTLGEYDVEVKTTTREKRLHRTTLDQLQPTVGRELYLISIQITRSSAAGSRTLAEQLALTRRLASSAVDQFDDLVSDITTPDAAWAARWVLRSRSALYLVDNTFPGLTTERLSNAGIDISRLESVEQTLNLDGLAEADPAPATLEQKEDTP